MHAGAHQISFSMAYIYIPGIIYAYIFLDVYTWPSTAVSYDLFDGSGVPADLDNVHT